jgi:hypothetical protein
VLKKVAVALVAGSFAIAAQSALADSEQFWNGKHYQGVADLPFPSLDSANEARREATMPERTAPAPYETPDAYFS